MTDELLPALPAPFMELHKCLTPVIYDAWAEQLRAYAREAIRLALENGLPVEVRDDARRYRTLKPMLIAADFAYDVGERTVCALIFQIPDDARVSADLDSTLDEISPPAGEVA